MLYVLLSQVWATTRVRPYKIQRKQLQIFIIKQLHIFLNYQKNNLKNPFMQVIFPPNKLPNADNKLKIVFLAGSIDMGKSVDWQTELAEMLPADWNGILLNPRRKNWDSSWVQSIENEQFKEQVEWELSGLELADLVIFYFAPESSAPITLMEFGLFARTKKSVVCCPEGFWRKGNVDIVCKKYNIFQVENLKDLATFVKDM